MSTCTYRVEPRVEPEFHDHIFCQAKVVVNGSYGCGIIVAILEGAVMFNLALV